MHVLYLLSYVGLTLRILPPRGPGLESRSDLPASIAFAPAGEQLAVVAALSNAAGVRDHRHSRGAWSGHEELDHV
jgi:hypothetical protein